jgi:type IV pilus assembly protein PilB
MTHPFAPRSLVEILLKRGLLGPDEAAAVERKNGSMVDVLRNDQRISPEDLAWALAEQCGLVYEDLEGFTVPAELLDLLSADRAYALGVAPCRREEDVLTVAVANPLDLHLPETLERICGLRIELRVASPNAIERALARSEGAARVLKDVSEDFRLVKVSENSEDREEVVELDALGEDGQAPVIRLINTILRNAIQKRASDVHLETYDQGVMVKYRIDGVLYPATGTLDRRHHGALVSRLKVMAELDIAEKRVPQDGRFRLRTGGRDIDLRISILPGVFGEDVVVRILDKSLVTDQVRSLQLESLGIDAATLKRLRRSIHEPYGMVLITGPTGSGKTTTLYAALSELHTGAEKIVTIEDPVEYQLDGVVQIAVNEKKGLTFARGLRSILRHDPDKIMVGEIRDSETAQIAVQSALTGHLVFTTVHANNSIDVIGRMTHMGIDLYNFVTALNCVMAQRLVRRVCPHCRSKTTVDGDLLEQSGLDPEQCAKQTWYEGRGCAQCNDTGYRGRHAITEFLLLTPRIRQMILDRRPADELQKAACEEGMTTLRQSGLAKALAGETTLREINRVTFVE